MSIVVHHVAYYSVLATGGAASLQAGLGRVPGGLIASFELSLYIFFVLSGYLLSRPFLRAIANGTRQPSVRRYARNRVLRILPAFWFVIMLTLLRRGTSGSSPGEVLAIFGFAQSYWPSDASAWIGQTWSIDVEIVFYALLPVFAAGLAWVLGRRLDVVRRMAVVIGALVLVYVASVAFRTGGIPTDYPFERSFPAMVFAIVPGVVLAALEQVVPGRISGARWVRPLGLAGAVLGVVLVAAWVELDPAREARRAVCGSIGVGLIVLWPMLRQWADGSCLRLFDNRPLQWLGERSYSIFLLHIFVLLELRGLVSPGDTHWQAFWTLIGPEIAIVLPLAAFSYRFVELPFLGLRDERAALPAAVAPGGAASAPTPTPAAAQAAEIAP